MEAHKIFHKDRVLILAKGRPKTTSYVSNDKVIKFEHTFSVELKLKHAKHMIVAIYSVFLHYLACEQRYYFTNVKSVKAGSCQNRWRSIDRRLTVLHE